RSACQVGIADGTFAAALAARHQAIVPPGGSRAFLAPLPVATLDRPDLADLLVRLGLRTLGDLAALPGADLATRFGAEGARAVRLASGLDGDPKAARPPPPPPPPGGARAPPAPRPGRRRRLPPQDPGRRAGRPPRPPRPGLHPPPHRSPDRPGRDPLPGLALRPHQHPNNPPPLQPRSRSPLRLQRDAAAGAAGRSRAG